MNFRKISILVALLVLVGALALTYVLVIQKPPAKRTATKERVNRVKFREVTNRDLTTQVTVTGRLMAEPRTEIFAEVTGVYRGGSRPFKEGNYFAKGGQLVRMDNTEAKASLLAQKSSLLNQITLMLPDLKVDYPESYPNWQQYLDSFDPEAKIKPLPGAVSEQEKYFVSAKNLYNLFYTIQAAEIRLDKYVIHAPFSGTVLEAAIDEGTLVRTGQRIGIFASARSFELEAAMNLKDLKFIRKGDAVTLYSPDIKGEWKGQVVRISDRLDPNTQTVRVFVKVTGENLKEGMYLTAEVDGTSVEKVVKLPRKLLVGNESVYIIEDSTLKLHTITPIKFSTNEVIIKGVPDNSLLLDEVISGAFEGMKVSPY